jgi:two-component system, NtrC family, sensor kinase
METHFDESLEKINAIPQDVGRAFLNLFTNAFYSVAEKKKTLQLLKGECEYEPTVTVSTKAVKSSLGYSGVQVRVRDNGMGIPEKAVDKIFQPFFTTKPTGQGTGLGLSLSYEIIKQGHGGEIKVKTKEGEFAEFIVDLPA